MIKLHKKVKEVHAYGCSFRLIEEDDGIIIEVIPLVEGKIDLDVVEKAKWRCKSTFDMFGNLVGCKTINCSSPKSCKVCEYDYHGQAVYACVCTEKCEEEEEEKEKEDSDDDEK